MRIKGSKIGTVNVVAEGMHSRKQMYFGSVVGEHVNIVMQVQLYNR